MGRLARAAAVLGLALAALAATAPGAGASGRALDPHARFFVPAPDAGAVQQELGLLRAHDLADAVRLGALLAQGHAVWFTGGTPQQVERQVRETMLEAAFERATPVLVAYDIPGRDCGSFSAGGAADLASYEQWIAGFARGIGHGSPIVILEPDGLGLLPQTNCGSTVFTDADRYAELNDAVDVLGAAGARVYLDGTHPGWQNVGDAASRLLAAGVQRAGGFFLNVSAFQYTTNDVFYGTWISDCIAYATQVAPGDFADCPNQYWDGGPASNWQGAALSPYQVWSDTPLTPLPVDGNDPRLTSDTAGIDSRWALDLGSVQPTTHFVVDTSRDGQGPWNWAAAGYPSAAVAQDFCNPPGRGAGPRPTANTGNPLVDAYLWVKVPGESDGSCTRGASGTVDPLWGIATPAAGGWFPQQALQLAQLASPALLP
ncbi:MAG TPA: glycoside hydrolase family 6 protein [Gaiellaceae bacterium]|nr:glycoside hydrolase family 6 protein [Gaiellaceae bacterium]